MNDRKHHNKGHQKGMALVEVMLAALVLSVGSAAFLKLQRLGLQHSFNDTARTQSAVIARNFADALRSNIRFINLDPAKKVAAITATSAEAVVSPPACGVGGDIKVCAQAALNYHIYLAKLQMLENFQPGQSLLCFRESGDRIGYMRLTMLWLDNSSKKGTTLTAANCPASFDAVAGDEDHINNSVTIYAQL